MKLRTRTCQAVGCQRQIGAFMLMCAEHWDLVPAKLRDEVTRARLRKAAGERGAVVAYSDAASRAIAGLKEKQERLAREKSGPSGSLFT